MMCSRRFFNALLLSAAAALAAVAILAIVPSGSSGAQNAGSNSLESADMSNGLVIGLSEGAAGWGGRSTTDRLNQLASRSDARWLRDAFVWSKIEPSPGKFTFAYYDHYVLLAARRGLHLVVQLVGTPSWAGRNYFSVPANPTAYAQYVAAVVHRYGPHGSFWAKHPSLSGSAISTFELWNEPYYDNGNDGHYDPGRYARLVKAASVAGHSADPSVQFLLEAEMASHLNGVWTWWVDALYHALPSLNRYIDGIAVHDFGYQTMTLHPIVYGQPYENYGSIRRIEDIRRQFLRHGAAGKPFWIMETGWSTCTEHTPYCVSAAKQAANLATLFGYLHTTWKSWVKAAFIYRYGDGAQPMSVQGGYGLVHLDGSAKPALRLFRTFAATST